MKEARNRFTKGIKSREYTSHKWGACWSTLKIMDVNASPYKALRKRILVERSPGGQRSGLRARCSECDKALEIIS